MSRNAREVEQNAEALLEAQENLMEALKTTRRQRFSSQEEMANTMGVTRDAVDQFERYDANPTLATIRKYALALGVVVDYEVHDFVGYQAQAQTDGISTGWKDAVGYKPRQPRANYEIANPRISTGQV